ncbi:TNFAIP3-interacting protein 2 isoform X2 [Motacilla alba alba]|uniref:TNFAIP3-interacting protein 2 isoform X2 n=1 Tax=Motacilla alba alba TaxID=1094192 RepID=UPI0018D5A183|nr:TNFAIP3-interacting protein 2 isoform X2 [Motacilla alba alba]
MHLSGLLLALEKEQKGAAPAMCSVSEAGSTDPLVTRFRQVEETLEKLRRENRSLKNKVPRYNALCTLYHESVQQLKHVQLQLAAKEATIRELRGSLARQRQPPAAGGDAAAGAEPARSLVESLLEQLEQARDSERLSARRAEALGQEVQKLNQQLEDKNGEIQQMINQPPYEKEREILRLQKTLAEREKAQATSDVLCRSLTDETHQLQRKLASTAEMCQHLAKCLEEKQRKEKGNSDDQTPTERSNQLLDNETSLQALICNLQEENRMLKQKVAHVLVYKDDFTSERSDRERAQSRIQELQAEVACLQHQLARKQDSRDTSSHFRVHAGNQNHLYVQTNVEHLRGNSPGQTGTRRTKSQSEQASPPGDNGNLGSEGRAQGELRCPHCMRFFSDELSDEFLKHVAECCQ